MNIIRSKVVELSTIPAIAYKVKLRAGGSGIQIHRTDKSESAFCEISKEGNIMPNPRNHAKDFPEEAFEEAQELLIGQAYSGRGKVNLTVVHEAEQHEIEVPEDEAPGTHADAYANVVDSPEYIALIDHYSDADGKMNFKLMNKQFIQFASRSKSVGELVANRATEQDILLHVVKNRAAYFANQKEFLSDDAATALIVALEDIDHRGAFKDLKLAIRKMLAR
ncbi:MAG: hypothetical protein FWG38_00115 [Defluviitaleaceae bacterium]|nr:hypothetical protein [Defluviitaleaceae bacterium]